MNERTSILEISKKNTMSQELEDIFNLDKSRDK
jgi:hypothetical protein